MHEQEHEHEESAYGQQQRHHHHRHQHEQQVQMYEQQQHGVGVDAPANVGYDESYGTEEYPPTDQDNPYPSAPMPQTIIVHESLRSLVRPALAELLGSAMFIFIACGAGMTTIRYQSTGAQTIGIALTFGFSIFAIAYSIGHISGGHLNFAVTFTFAILRKISLLKCIIFFLAQWLGGLIGIGFLKLVTPKPWWVSCFALNHIHDELTQGHAFITEFILTFFLMLVIMAACDSNKSNQTLVPLAIGMAVFCAHMIALPITGCSINPTRSFASAAAASGLDECPHAWDGHWVFWFAPLSGAATAGLLYEYCFLEGGYKIDALIDQYILRR